MKTLTNKQRIVRFLNIILVGALLCPPLPLWAQSIPPSMARAAKQFQSGSSTKSHSYGTSFGSSTTKQAPAIPVPGAYPNPSGNIPAGAGFGPTYQIHILGEVDTPGTYRVAPSTRLSEAVEVAGGVLGRGTERSIELRREGAKTRKIDLVSFKMLGDLDENPYLLDNDVIFVPLRTNVVQIEGAVRRPGIYELNKKLTLHKLVALAGGYSSGLASDQPLKVIRYQNGAKEIIDVPIDDNDTSHFHVDSADVVVVPHIFTKETQFDYDLAKLPGENPVFYASFESRVFVLGAVNDPGPYPFSSYYNLREYITLAGGLTKLAKSAKKIHIVSSDGKRRSGTFNSAVNPGDTIVIPERYMKPESMVQLVLGITSAALGITTTVLALTR